MGLGRKKKRMNERKKGRERVGRNAGGKEGGREENGLLPCAHFPEADR